MVTYRSRLDGTERLVVASGPGPATVSAWVSVVIAATVSAAAGDVHCKRRTVPAAGAVTAEGRRGAGRLPRRVMRWLLRYDRPVERVSGMTGSAGCFSGLVTRRR